MPEIVAEESDKDAVAEELGRRLREYNEQKAGSLRDSQLVLSMRADNGEIIAGLTAEIFWNAMYIEVLWVHERCRGNGYGAQLMREAERTALARECNVSYLTTFSFQAPAFYASLGYRRLGKLQDMPPGASLDWLYKPLATAGA